MVDPTSAVSPVPTTDARALEARRAVLLARLRRRSDDFAATVELQAVTAQTAALRQSDSSQSDRLVHGGLSGVEVIRQWLRSKVRRRSAR